MSSLLAPGSRAPDFTLDGSDERAHQLTSELRDAHVLLIFYPGNNTPG
jgi:peroxiredoxin